MDKNNEIEKEVEKSIEMSEDNSGIVAAAGLELMFGDDFPFTDVVQMQLQAKQVKLQQTNLQLNFQNNLILKNIYNENLKVNKELNSINNEIINLKSVIENKEMKEERENLAKEIIYNLKLENKNVKKSENKLFVYYASKLLLQIIDENKLTTKDFTQIEDKEYFTEIKEELAKQLEVVNENEKKEVERFTESYYVLKELKEEINSDKFLKNREIIDIYSEEIKEPDYPTILELEEDIKTSLKYGQIENSLKKYVRKLEELPNLYDKIFDEKAKYEAKKVEYENYIEYKRKMEKEEKLKKEYEEKKEIIKQLEEKINKFLTKHKDFEKYFNKINVKFENITFERKNLNNIIEEKKKEKINKLEYIDVKKILNNKIKEIELEKEKELKRKKNNRNIIITISIMASMIIAYIILQDDIYYNVKKNKGIAGYESYLKKYPNGKYAKEVKEKEENYYYEKATDITGYESYLKKYPNGKYVKEVKEEEDYYYEKAIDIAGYVAYQKKYPNGKYVKEVKEKEENYYYEKAIDITGYGAYLKKYPNGKYAKQAKKEIVLNIKSNMVLVERGTLDSFYIGKYEVTQEEFQAIMGYNPSYFNGNKNPVEEVTGYDATAYCNELSKIEGLTPYYIISDIEKEENNIINANVSIAGGKGYRLPTEAEWEYAARGGNKSKGYEYSGSNNVDEVAEYRGNNDKSTKPVGGKKSNELGIYDMSGNVWEWTETKYSSDKYCIRGGSWNSSVDRCEVAFRIYGYSASSHYYARGFRVCRVR